MRGGRHAAALRRPVDVPRARPSPRSLAASCWRGRRRRTRTSSPRAAATPSPLRGCAELGRELRGRGRRGRRRLRHRRHAGRAGRRARPPGSAPWASRSSRAASWARRYAPSRTAAFGGPAGDWSLDERFHFGGYARTTPELDAFAARLRGPARTARRADLRRQAAVRTCPPWPRRAPSPRARPSRAVVTGARSAVRLSLTGSGRPPGRPPPPPGPVGAAACAASRRRCSRRSRSCTKTSRSALDHLPRQPPVGVVRRLPGDRVDRAEPFPHRVAAPFQDRPQPVRQRRRQGVALVREQLLQALLRRAGGLALGLRLRQGLGLQVASAAASAPGSAAAASAPGRPACR